MFGTEVYYFPNYDTLSAKPPSATYGGVRHAGTFELSDDGKRVLRSFGFAKSLIVSNCCHYLLFHYGLAEGFPEFIGGRDGNRMPPVRVILSSYDKPFIYNQIQHHFNLVADTKELPSISSVISESQLSYNEDFWLLNVWKPNESGFTRFEFLSKRPLLNGYHVKGGCGTNCDFSTVSFAEQAKNTRPHVSMRSITLFRERVLLCASEEDVRNGCDPASERFDSVPEMLGIIDDMFEAAKTYPQDRK